MAKSSINRCKRCGGPSPKGRSMCSHNCYQQAWRANNPGYWRAYEAKRKKKRAHVSKWRKQHPKEYLATKAVASAVKRGNLVRPDKCSRCNKYARIEAHHPDYSKPLKVRWLCHQCHRIVEGRN